jgi:hypothetical protein
MENDTSLHASRKVVGVASCALAVIGSNLIQAKKKTGHLKNEA